MASPKALDLGSSLISVQELAKEPMLAIPQHYIRIEEPSTPSHGSDSSHTIPIIDMNHLVLGQVDLELENLHFACKDWGIFQLVNHGVGSSVVEKLRNEVQEFYKLPLEEKMRYNRKEGDVEGYGQTILLHESQTVDWADKLYMTTNPVHRRKAHLFPKLPSSLRESLESYISELQKLAMTLLGLMTKALKIERGEIEEMAEDGMQSVRMTYYPPCPQPEKVMGLTAHSDASLITILLQVNGVQGLQVKRDGTWIPVNVLPDAFVINVGDVLEIFSNGVYKSIEHRATVNEEKERISIGMFFNPKFQAEVGPSSTLLNPQNPPLFKRLGMETYVRDFFGRKLDGKSFLEQMRSTSADQNGVLHNSTV